LEEILYINEMIRQESLRSKDIEYTGYEDYPIEKGKIRSIIEASEGMDPIERSIHILKYLILLQPFPDGNHRTALATIKYLLRKNAMEIVIEPDEAERFQRSFYTLRFKVHRTYEALGVKTMMEKEDELTGLCRDFITRHLL